MFNRFFDNWPLPTILRVFAILLFLLDIGMNIFAMVTNHAVNGTAYGVGMVVALFVRNMYQPLVLLGLAELLRMKKVN